MLIDGTVKRIYHLEGDHMASEDGDVFVRLHNRLSPTAPEPCCSVCLLAGQ